MSTLYPDLPLTVFPSGGIDSFTTWLDIIASDGALVLQYQQAMQAGNTVLANQILAQIPSATQKIIKATDLNKMTQAILAVERFYQTDVEPYIQEQQANWLEIIQRFSYKGEWASGTTYEVNNFVSYTVSGATLIYLATSNPPVGTPPTNTNYWRLLSIQGQQGPSGEGVSYRQEWNSSAQYYTDDTVTYGGALWIATQNSQGQTPQSGSQYWKLVMSLGLTTYPIQDSEPTGQEVGGLWFNTQVNPTNYYQLATLENPATAAQISAGYEAYNDDGEVITGTQSMDDYLKTDGTNAMTGTLQANAGINVGSNNQLSINVIGGTVPNLTSTGAFTIYASTANALHLGVGSTNIVSIDNQSVTVVRPISVQTLTAHGEFNMSNNKITGLANGTAATDAMTVGQFEDMYVNNTYLRIGVTTTTGTYYILACGIELVFIPPLPTESSFTNAAITEIGNTFCTQLFTATYNQSPTNGSTLTFIEEGDYGSTGRLIFTYSGSAWTFDYNKQIREANQYFVFYPTEQ